MCGGAGGSSGWQAPEQLIARSGGEARQGYSTDVFSYGMLLFYCLTAGKHPFGEHYERDFNILQVNNLLLSNTSTLCVVHTNKNLGNLMESA